LCVIRKFVRDLDIPVEIIGVPTVREADGLAMSSRNAYLSAEERAVSARLHQTLQSMAKRIKGGEPIETIESDAAQALLDAGFHKVDYITVRDAQTLLPPDVRTINRRILAAAYLGKARLIDNIPL
ncbi:MAG: pantoate--beta-alanine ligase, partial [Micavibrio aeruginosavorus]